MRAWCAAILLGLACVPPEKANAPGNDTVIPSRSAKMVRAQGQQILDPDGKPLRLRCVNVDGWLAPIPYLISDSGNALLISPSELEGRLDEVVGAKRAARFWEQWRDAFITEADFRRMGELGFNCARLVVYHRAITNEAGSKHRLDERGLARIDDALKWGSAHGVYVVLDLHSAPGGQNGVATVSDVPSTDLRAQLWEGPRAEENQAAMVSIWKGLAARYRGNPALLGYDLLNEPAVPDSLPRDTLPNLYRRVIAAIREVDPDHMVIVEGDDLAHDFSMFDAPLDDNMAYEFHAYALLGQGPWVEPAQKTLDVLLALRREHDRPLWLGEFGERQLEWQKQMVELMEKNDVGWALYPWKRKMTFFWNPVLQRIEPTPEWYALAKYLAQPANGSVPKPSAAEAEAGMREILGAVRLESCIEDGKLANALVK